MKNKAYLHLTGGLGNQLFQYAALLSLTVDKKYIEIELGQPRLNKQQQPDIFDFHLSPQIEFLQASQSRLVANFYRKVAGYTLRKGLSANKNFFPTKLIAIIASVLFSIRRMKWISVVQATDNGYFSFSSPRHTPYLIGYFQSYRWPSQANIYPSLQELELKDPSDELNDFLQQIGKKKTIMVHIRLGDYRSEKAFGIPENKYYEDALDYLFNESDFQQIALFSNEPDEAISRIPSQYREKVLVVPEFRGSAAETLEAMRNMDAYIIANSSLSWWGAFLSYSKSPLVVAPKPWFHHLPEPRDIVPNNWHRVLAWSDVKSE